jgi:hypothetical protein
MKIFGIHISEVDIGRFMSIFFWVDFVIVLLLLFFLWKVLKPIAPKFFDFRRYARWQWKVDFLSEISGVLILLATILLPIVTIMLIIHYVGDNTSGVHIKF